VPSDMLAPTHARPLRAARTSLARVPLAAWLCALVACANAASWSLITPPFQVPDEQAHFAYVEELVRTQRLPSSNTQQYAPDEVVALEALRVGRVTFQPQHRTIATASEQRELAHYVAAAVASKAPGVGAAGDAASQPPLYYALEAIPYVLGKGGGVLDQLALMRLLSAAMAGVCALFVFLFLREALPSSSRAWTIGGLAVALMPALAFISGGVNPEALLCAVAAALFYCLARGFRRGLTRGLAVAIGVLVAVGFLTKLNFLGLAPGVTLGLVLLARRASRGRGLGAAVRMLAPALAVAALPVCVYVASNVLAHHHTLGIGSHGLAVTAKRSIFGELSYIWQLYLPRLPGMGVDFADISPARQLWFDGLVGEYGFEDTFFPGWVYGAALIPAGAILALGVREVLVCGSALRRRAAELCTYLAIAIGLLGLIGASSYTWFPREAAGFPEPRYLLPLIALFGVAIALATRGAGRRWGAAVGALIVVLFVAHDVFSQLQEIARFYG
jgi:4-amino-4-deoxy-L-arabinose transferase-like glycosyltransferase